MELAEARIQKQGNSVHVSHGDDSGLYVEFHMESVFQSFLSEKEGRQIYKDVPCITIHTLGSNLNRLTRPVREQPEGNQPSDPQRFPHQWADFQAQREHVSVGMPLTEWPALGKSQILELKTKHIHTVEQLAAVSDINLGGLGLGAREIREKAKLWLSQATDGKEIMKMMNENKAMKEEMTILKQQMATLMQGKTSAVMGDMGAVTGLMHVEPSENMTHGFIHIEEELKRPARPKKTI